MKRLQQENKKLRDQLNNLNELEDTKQRLQKENEELWDQVSSKLFGLHFWRSVWQIIFVFYLEIFKTYYECTLQGV